MNWSSLIFFFLIQGATAYGVWDYQANKYQNEISTILLDQANANIKSANESLAYERMAHEALQAALTRNRDLQAAAARTDAEYRSLRGQLATASNRIKTASIEAVREYAATAGAVFGECAQEIAGLASKADGHASDVQTFRDAWPVAGEPKGE